MKRSELAMASMTSGKTNCAQSVLYAFCEEMGLQPDLALKLSLGFGGGMAHTGQICGAVSAAYMVLGLIQDFNPDNPKQNRDKVGALIHEFNSRFVTLHGSTNCSKLLGYNLKNPEALAIVREKNLTVQLCPRFVYDSVEILEAMKADKIT